MSFDYRGIFINLDRSAERRAHIEGQLERLELRERYTRFPAIDARQLPERARAVRPEEEACFRSHYEALTLGRPFGTPVHIIEDDLIFATQFSGIAGSAQSAFASYDIVFTDTYVMTLPPLMRELKDLFDRCLAKAPNAMSFQVLDIKTWYRGLTSSYFVMPDAIEKMRAALARGLAAGPARPLDLFIRDEAHAGRLRLGCVFPFITTPFHPDGALPTTMASREPNAAVSRAVLSLISYSFFIDRDLSKLPPALNDRLAATDDEHRKLLSGVLNFVLSSPEYAPY